MSEQRKIVAHEIAIQRAWGPRHRRRKVLPRQIVPKSIAVEYSKVLRAMFRLAMEAYRPVIELFKANLVRADAADKKKPKTKKTWSKKPQARDLKRLLDDAEKRLEAAISTSQVETLASKFAARTSTYQRVQMGRQVRAALGADPYMRDAPLAGVAEDFIAQNVSLIKRIPKRLHEKIEGLVMNSVVKSEININLADEIEKQFGVAERHATLIARDQLSKYYGAVNKVRQEELGVNKFIWRTVNDERVRDSHAALEGQTFSWDDLPVNERGEEIYPGSDYQCRCSAEPVLDDLLDDVDKAEKDMEPPGFPEIDEDLEQ